ncbi:MAG TPA: Ig-like domain-containing protein, partial [Bacillota bacterium]|nr:Ig-like domain-containing protein [Bacillota bacterium]
MIPRHTSKSTTLKATVIGFIALSIFFSFVFTGSATDSGPLLSAFTPAGGSNISQTQTTVSFKAYDPDGLDDSSIQMTFNGDVVPITIKHVELGYWETYVDSSCSANSYQVWISQGTDPSQATISATVTTTDVNTVAINTRDNLGNTSATEWTFNCMKAPVISAVYPANNSFHTSLSTISAKLTDNGVLDQASIIFKLDSNLYTGSFDPATGLLSYTPSQPLAEGTHSLYIEAKDNLGNTQSSSTTFTIATDTTGPVFQDLSPSAGASLTTTAANISFIATDPQQIDEAAMQVKVNGITIPHTVTYPEIGHYETQTVYLSCTPDPVTSEIWIHEGWDYTKATIRASVVANDHNTVTVSTRDKLGNPSTTSWNFDCMLSPVISNQFPAYGTVQTFVPKVSAVVIDNGTIDPASISLKMNSSVVPHSFNSTTGSISYTPQLPLPVGNYTFDLEVKDAAGNVQTSSWTFTVVTDGNGPVISGITPSEGGIVAS